MWKYIVHRSSAGGRLKASWRVANVCASLQPRCKRRVSRGFGAIRWQSLRWTPSHCNEDLYLKLQILMREVSRMLKVHQLSVCWEHLILRATTAKVCMVLDGLWKPSPIPLDLYQPAKYPTDLGWIILSEKVTKQAKRLRKIAERALAATFTKTLTSWGRGTFCWWVSWCFLGSLIFLA